MIACLPITVKYIQLPGDMQTFIRWLTRKIASTINAG